MIGMREWEFARGLASVHGDVAHFDLRMEGNHVEAADLGAAAGSAFEFFHDLAADVGLKGVGSGVVQRGKEQNDHRSGGDQRILPPASTPGNRLGHRDSTPSEGVPEILTLLSARRLCSQETSNSLTFS